MNTAILRAGIVGGVLILLTGVGVVKKVNAEESNNFHGMLGILPFAPLGIDEDDAENIAVILGKRLSTRTKVFEHEDIMDALDDTDCDDEEDWDDQECIYKTGEEVNADYIVGGTIGKVGTLIVSEVSLFEIQSRSKIWSQQYKSEGGIEKFIQGVPEEIVNGVLSNLPKNKAGDTLTTSEGRTTGIVKVPVDVGIVKGPTIGANGIFTLGKVTNAQSLAGFRLWFCYPTTELSHLRVKTGVPIWHSNESSESANKNYPDPYLSIEHEWGWKSFGVTAGLAYMSLMAYKYSIRDYHTGYYDSVTYTFEHDRSNSFNVVFGVRGGRATGGFFGRFSFPFAFAYDRENRNSFIEYSLFGVIGIKTVKVAIGNMGMIKLRDADKITRDNGTTVTAISERQYEIESYNDYDELKEFYALLPCIKVAKLFGDRFVVNLILDLGGTIIPRLDDDERWKPSIGIDFTYSFEKLDGPHVMDGS